MASSITFYHLESRKPYAGKKVYDLKLVIDVYLQLFLKPFFAPIHTWRLTFPVRAINASSLHTDQVSVFFFYFDQNLRKVSTKLGTFSQHEIS
jgi:hypothetical protein